MLMNYAHWWKKKASAHEKKIQHLTNVCRLESTIKFFVLFFTLSTFTVYEQHSAGQSCSYSVDIGTKWVWLRLDTLGRTQKILDNERKKKVYQRRVHFFNLMDWFSILWDIKENYINYIIINYSYLREGFSPCSSQEHVPHEQRAIATSSKSSCTVWYRSLNFSPGCSKEKVLKMDLKDQNIEILHLYPGDFLDCNP